MLIEQAFKTCEFSLTPLHTLVNIPNSELNFRNFLARCLLHSYCNYLQLHLVIVNNSFYVVFILGRSCFSCPVFFFSFFSYLLLMFVRSFACLYRQARVEMSFDGITNEADEIWWFRKLFPSYVFFLYFSYLEIFHFIIILYYVSKESHTQTSIFKHWRISWFLESLIFIDKFQISHTFFPCLILANNSLISFLFHYRLRNLDLLFVTWPF